MTARLNAYASHLNLVKPLMEYGQAVQAMGLEPSLVKLVEVRASQINGCAVCLHMHASEARKEGETEDRILMLDAWHETPLYSAREKAALAWTDALTRLSQTHAPDEAYEAAKTEFSDEDLIKLTLLIGVINAFDKIGVGFRIPPVTLPQKAAA